MSALRPLSNVSINNGGAVAFLGYDEQNPGFVVAVGTGGPPLFIADHTGIGTNTSIGVAASSLDIAFFEKLGGGAAGPDILRRGNSFSKVTIADTNGSLFSSIHSFSLDDMGNVAFTAEFDVGGEGVFIGNGLSPTITSVADSFGPFDTFSGVSISNSGVAFGATLDLGQGSGVYTGPNHLTDKVLTK